LGAWGEIKEEYKEFKEYKEYKEFEERSQEPESRSQEAMGRNMFRGKCAFIVTDYRPTDCFSRQDVLPSQRLPGPRSS
jgi:hypothetical protein